MRNKIKIMLVEDNLEYRKVIELAFKLDPTIKMDSQFGTAEFALRSLQDMSTRKVPDIVLLDLCLPGMSGLEALPYFKRSLPGVNVIILTQSDNEKDIMAAISLGAAGYLLKSATANQIKEGIHTVMDGGATLDPFVAKYILGTLKGPFPKDQHSNSLTPREMEILTLLGDGLLKKEIAEKLKLSFATIDTHMRRIYQKLEVQNAPAAITKAFQLGILQTKR